MPDPIKKIMNMMTEGSTLAERISLGNRGNGGPQMSGRGHGRLNKKGSGQKAGREAKTYAKRDMLYLVRELVQTFRQSPMKLDKSFDLDGGSDLTSTKNWANLLVHDVQYFDCDEIYGYVDVNLDQMYPSDDVPPHPDAVLPAENVGLYVSNYNRFSDSGEGEDQVLFICIPTLAGAKERDIYSVFSCMKSYTSDGTPLSQGPFPWGNIILSGPTPRFEFDGFTHGLLERTSEVSRKVQARRALKAQLRVVAALLQTINQPRFVAKSTREVGLFKRQAFKKATGRFTPDSWSLVSWNVDKPTQAKPYEEGAGVRQALHFRRGHWRKSDKEWERARWSGMRNRWEKYIHGYEAGHPAFGVKKSYHLPRKGEK